MRRPNKKLLKTMMLGTLAFMMMLGSARVSATPLQVFKCRTTRGQVLFQDFACKEDQTMELLEIRFNQSADIAPGLRPQENLVQILAHQRQVLEIITKS